MYLLNIPLSNFLNYVETPEYLLFFACIAFFDAICMVPFAYLRFVNKPIKYSAIKVFQGIFQTLLILAFFYLIPVDVLNYIGMDEKVTYPFVANVIASLSGVLLLFPIIKQVRFFFDWHLFKKKIGRASCRERVYRWEVEGVVKGNGMIARGAEEQW